MPTLDEYLGGIFASLTQARIMADAQAVSAAEAYARHDLLRHFAVPHLRFGEIELTIPVAIQSIGAPPAIGGLDAFAREELRASVLDALARLLGLSELPEAAVALARPAVETRIDRLADASAGRPLDQRITEFARDASQDLVKLLRQVDLGGPQLKRTVLQEALRDLSAKLFERGSPQQRLGDLQVIAESHRLREQRPSDVIFIKMSVREEGMEWQTMEMSDGRTERKLLPE